MQQDWSQREITCKRTISEHRTGVTSTLAIKDKLFSGSYEGLIRVFDFETGQYIKSLSGHSLSVWSMCYDDEGDRMFSASSDDSIRVFLFRYEYVLNERFGTSTLIPSKNVCRHYQNIPAKYIL